jgi:hypothetical protein
MKNTKYFFLALTIILSGLASITLMSNSSNQKNYVKVVYFHTDYRCATCTKLEKYSQETVEKYFANDLKSGKIVWESINYEEDKNEHYIDKFNLYNKSLILMKYENGKLKEWKNLEKIWELVSNKSKYVDYVKKEIKKYQ